MNGLATRLAGTAAPHLAPHEPAEILPSVEITLLEPARHPLLNAFPGGLALARLPPRLVLIDVLRVLVLRKMRKRNLKSGNQEGTGGRGWVFCMGFKCVNVLDFGASGICV